MAHVAVLSSPTLGLGSLRTDVTIWFSILCSIGAYCVYIRDYVLEELTLMI